MDVRVMRKVRRNGQEKTPPRIRWWLLKGEKHRNFQRNLYKKQLGDTTMHGLMNNVGGGTQVCMIRLRLKGNILKSGL